MLLYHSLVPFQFQVAAFAEMQGHTASYFRMWSADYSTPISTSFFFLGIGVGAVMDYIVHRTRDRPSHSDSKTLDLAASSHTAEAQKADPTIFSVLSGDQPASDTEAIESIAHEALGHIDSPQKMKQLGMTVGFGIALHNLAEGAAIFIASLSNRRCDARGPLQHGG